jgi:tetratricopeptide (TPR) repeat protein
MAASVLRLRGDASMRLQQAFETTNRYVLAFFNAYLKGDRQELAFLRRDPAANGAPPGLATIRELPATIPAPTLDEIYTAITSRGVDAAMTEFEAARTRDPEASTFREAEINRLGYRLLRSQQPAEALVIFRRNIALYPASSNALDSLAEALESTGDKAGAVETTRKALEVLARQELTEQQRVDMRTVLEARLQRLGKN